MKTAKRVTVLAVLAFCWIGIQAGVARAEGLA